MARRRQTRKIRQRQPRVQRHERPVRCSGRRGVTDTGGVGKLAPQPKAAITSYQKMHGWEAGPRQPAATWGGARAHTAASSAAGRPAMCAQSLGGGLRVGGCLLKVAQCVVDEHGHQVGPLLLCTVRGLGLGRPVRE